MSAHAADGSTRHLGGVCLGRHWPQRGRNTWCKQPSSRPLARLYTLYPVVASALRPRRLASFVRDKVQPGRRPRAGGDVSAAHLEQAWTPPGPSRLPCARLAADAC